MRKIYPVVIGLGYVGFPIFLSLQKHFKTVGFDINLQRIKQLKKGVDLNKTLNTKFKIKNNSYFTNNVKLIKKCNFFIVTVPTPITKNNKPDLKKLISAAKLVGKVIKRGDIVFFESTVYPGVTNKICLKLITKISGLSKDEFTIGYSPERINPGDKVNTLNNITKIVSTENDKAKKIVLNVYRKVSKKVIFNNKIIEAETSKVIENIQRDLNIALMNEIYIICEKQNINFYKVLELASSKWNFIKFNPGLVGGHCLPVDPYYFSYFARTNKLNTEIILAGRKVNNKMLNFCIEKIKKEIKKRHLTKKSKILILGLTYKPNVPDIRNSIPLKIFKKLKKNYYVSAMDPVLSKNDIRKFKVKKFRKNFKKYDLVIVLVRHDQFKKLKIKNEFKIFE